MTSCEKPNLVIVLLYIFHIIHPQRQKRSVQPFCFRGEHSKGLSNQADVELDMINAIPAADLRTFALIVSAHPYCARKSTSHAMPRHASSARAKF